jgi:hypothetical protein
VVKWHRGTKEKKVWIRTSSFEAKMNNVEKDEARSWNIKPRSFYPIGKKCFRRLNQ